MALPPEAPLLLGKIAVCHILGIPEGGQMYKAPKLTGENTANLHTKILDFRGFDSSRILTLRGGIPRPMGNFPESLSQAILVGVILVGRLGVHDGVGAKGSLDI